MIRRIRSSIKSRLLQFTRGERGSFTLEATLVMPVMLLLVLCFLLFGMYMYQKIVLYYSAGVTAERAAFSWDNSYKDSLSGIAPSGSYDGLYWRIGDDRMLESVIGVVSGGDSSVVVQVPGSGGQTNDDLASYKLGKASEWLSDGSPSFEGEAGYERGVLQKAVEVKLKQPITLSALERLLGKREPKAVAAASVVDPVEFIRSVDLARYYSSKLSQGVFSKKDAGAVLASYTPKAASPEGAQP